LSAEAAYSPLGGDPSVADLVARACYGDQQAWDALVDRYSSLIWWICRRYRLADADAAVVSHSVWLRLVDRLDRVGDPAALASWLASATQRECSRILRAGPDAEKIPYAEKIPDEGAPAAAQELLLAERHAALFEAYADLPPGDQRLLALLTADPREPYAKIGAALGMPVRSIAPSRRRCLAKLRRHPAIAALITADEATGA
jgi:RNA polymerase sigma factor (sigma-70 family)